VRSYKAVSLIFCAAVCATLSGLAKADDQPSGLGLLKQHPEFATITKITDLADQTGRVDIALCRSKRQAVNCELFEGTPASLEAMADYVYLYAVYRGKYDKTAAGKPTQTLADGLLREAADKGYARALLDHYSAKYTCNREKDPTDCVLHKLFVSSVTWRYIMQHSGHAVYLLHAKEDGSGDIFEG